MKRRKKLMSFACSVLSVLIFSGCAAQRVTLNREQLEQPQKVLLVVNDVNRGPVVAIGSAQATALGLFGLAGGVVGGAIAAGRSNSFRAKLDGWQIRGAVEKTFFTLVPIPPSWQIVKLSSFDEDLQSRVITALLKEPSAVDKKKEENRTEIGAKSSAKKNRETLQVLKDQQITRVLVIDLLSYGIMDDPTTWVPTYNVFARGRLFDPEKRDKPLWQQDVKTQSFIHDKKADRVNFELELVKEPKKIQQTLLTHVQMAMEALAADFKTAARAGATN